MLLFTSNEICRDRNLYIISLGNDSNVGDDLFIEESSIVAL